jgi:hypothetical protein
MNPPRISMLCLAAVVAILGLLLLWPPGAMADPIFATVLGTKRVSDIPGFAPVLDPNLVNPMGITASAGSPDWVANNGSGVATLYDTQGQRQALVVSIPSPGNPNGGASPTGDVFNIALAIARSRSPTASIRRRPSLCSRQRAEPLWAGIRELIPTGKFDGPNGVSTLGPSE